MDPLHAPVFILGLHRSGTTLLYEMLAEAGLWNSVSAWHVIEFDSILAGVDIARSRQELAERFAELGLHTRGVDVVKISPDTMEEYGFILDNHGRGFSVTPRHFAFFRQVCEVIQGTHERELPLLLKNPWDFCNAQRIKQLIPTARFVYIHRDPSHIFSSMWRFTKRAIDQPMPYVALLSRRYQRLIDSPWKLGAARFGLKIGADAYMRWLIRSCAARCRDHLRDAARIPHRDRVDVLYEDLCRAPRETIESVLEHFDLPMHDRDYRAMVGKRQSKVDDLVRKHQPLVRKKMSDYLASVGLDIP